MLSVLVFLPLAAAAVLALARRLPHAAARWVWVAISAVEVFLVAWMWLGYKPGAGLAYEQQAAWIPNVGASYHVGLDGLSLPLVALSALLFLAVALYDLREQQRPRAHAALFLFLQTTCLGLFAAQDLIVFFLFFDLSIVAMYFVIVGWGSGDAARSALKFFLYTFLGSLALLVGFIGLFLAAQPHTFDMVALTAAAPLQDQPVAGGLVLGAIGLGLAIKTPTFPFHTWLPPAHTDAPATGSAILAGVLLKMGTYGFARIAMVMLPEAWRAGAWLIIAIGIISVLYGALVALAQTDFKRMVAYTSVNHMGYVILALGAAGLVGGTRAREVAVSGAVTQMVSHGLITAGLFLLAGVLADRAGTYRLDAYGGLAHRAPRFTALLAVAAFASLGLPGFSGFIAEFQIFAGAIGATPVAALGLPGIIITAALFLRALQLLTTGSPAGGSVRFTDLEPRETISTGMLMALALVIGIVPRGLLDVIEPAATSVVALVSR